MHQVRFLYVSFVSFKKDFKQFYNFKSKFYLIQGYVTSSKKYVDFASNTATRLSYYSYMFQSSFMLMLTIPTLLLGYAKRI